MRFRLLYTDAKGKDTDRTVKLLSYTDTGVIAGSGWPSQGLRTFLFERIKEVTSLETGEILTGAELKAELRRNAKQQ